MRGPYTYVTISLTEGQAPHVGAHFCTSDLRVSAGLVQSERPFLTLTSDEANVHISTTGGGPVTERDVSLAREIFNAAARYLADCERLQTEQPATAKATDQAA